MEKNHQPESKSESTKQKYKNQINKQIQKNTNSDYQYKSVKQRTTDLHKKMGIEQKTLSKNRNNE